MQVCLGLPCKARVILLDEPEAGPAIPRYPKMSALIHAYPRKEPETGAVILVEH